MALTARQDWQRQVFAPRTLALWAVLTLLVALAGPFGTYAGMRFPVRLGYWGGLIGASIPVAYIFRVLTDRGLAHLRNWQRSVTVAVIFSSAFAPVVYLTTKALEGVGQATMVPFWVMWLTTFVASILVCTVKSLWQPVSADLTAAPPAAFAPAIPAHQHIPQILARIDADKRGDVLHLSVRDHYVVVQTARGEATLLMRFADAIRELDGVEGLQVHRSHWVAKMAVAEPVRASGRLQLRLRDGRLVPVSRSYLEEVRANGLL